MANAKCTYCRRPSNDKYKKAIETIHHLSLHWEFMSEEDLRSTLRQIHESTTETVLAVEELAIRK